MFKATDLRERSEADLRELEKTLARDVFQNRFKNFTNRLDDTSSIRKTKRDLARVKTVLAQIAAKAAGAAVATEAKSEEAAPKKAKAAKPASAPKKASAKAADAGEATDAPKAKKTSTKKKSEAK